MKLNKSFFYLVLFFLTTGAVSKDASPGTALSEGSKIPDLTLLTDQMLPERLSALGGKTILLQFWSSSNAQSRIDNAKINNIINSHPSSPIHLISVALDESAEMARQIALIDGIRQENFFAVSSILTEQTMREFRLSPHHYSNYLINAHGVIIGRNLSADELKQRF